jgi:hypothetical protein
MDLLHQQLIPQAASPADPVPAVPTLAADPVPAVDPTVVADLVPAADPAFCPVTAVGPVLATVQARTLPVPHEDRIVGAL